MMPADYEDDQEIRNLIGSPRNGHGRSSEDANGLSKLKPTPSSARAQYENFESLDYEVCDNTVYKAHEASESPQGRLLYRTTKYSICAAVGIIVAFTAFVVNFGVENIAGLRFWLTFKAVEQHSYFGAWLVLTVCQLGLSALAVSCVLYIGPAAAGSGIPDVQAYLNGVDVPAVLFFRTLVAKVLGSLGSVGGGLAVGKEGPFVHIGACVASLLSQGRAWGSHPRLKWLKRFKNDRERRDIVTCGSSAGVAAAFRAPVGGLLFGLELMSSHWSQHLLLSCFFTTAVVSVTARVLMQMCSSGGCGFFGEGNFIMFHISDAQESYEYYELFPMLLVAILGGLLGSLFNYTNTLIIDWRKRNLRQNCNRTRMIEALVIAAITSTVTFVLPLFMPCKPCPEPDALTGRVAPCPRQDNSHSGNFVSFNCAGPDEYNDLATLFFNTQDDAIRNLFSSKTPHEYSKASLLTFFLAFYGLTIITYGIAVPAGLFVPGILVGASYGRLVGLFVRHLHPQSSVHEGTYALLGSASYMAGSMRIAVSVCVMLLELTNNLNLLPLIMLVIVIAKAVGDGTGVPGVYEIQVARKNFPFMPSAPCKQLRHITAGELLTHNEPVCFNRVEQVSTIVAILQSNQHNGFPVLDDSAASLSSSSRTCTSPSSRAGSALIGIVLRHHLIVLLQTGRSFQHTPSVTPNSSRIAFMHDITDFDKPVSTESPTIADIVPRLSAQAMAMYIDLAPYVNPPSFIVQENTTASKVFDLFRTLGLRHLCVVPRQHTVVGILSRQDFMENHADNVIQSRLYTDIGPRSPKRGSRANARTPKVQRSKVAEGAVVKPGRISVLRPTKANLE